MKTFSLKNLASKKYVFLFVLAVFFIGKSLVASNLTAYLYMAQFKSPTSGPYIETYLNVIGNTVEFRKNVDGKYQSKVEILYLFKQNNEIKAFEKYILESPFVDDSTLSYPNYTDVQRIAIKNGIYNFEVRIRDLYDTSNVFSYKDIITIAMDKKYQFSDIELIKSYKETKEENILSKNGLDIVPFVSSFFSDENDTILFYSELYNTAEKEDFLLQYYIESQSKNKVLEQYSSYKRLKAEEVTPIINSFDISELPTGNYNLVLSLKNRENKLLCQKKFFFQRYNSRVIKAMDTVKLSSVGLVELTEISKVSVMQDYIKSLYPILDQRDLTKANNVIKSDDIELMKNFFNNYWKSNSANPEQDWSIYKQNVDRVNRSYGSQIKRGYESDRGRVFLKYGQPNDINRSTHEPGSYPYEIWHYFEINGETNKKFVFYNPEIAGDDYTLLHSDVTGERNNPYWQKELSRRTSTSPNDIDNYSSDPQYGNRSQDLYNR